MPRTAGPRGAARGQAHRHTQSKTVACGQDGARARQGAEVVGGHEVHRGAAGQAHAAGGCVHRAAPQHQLQEPGVVGGGGDQAPASRFKHWGLGHVDQGDASAGERVAGKGLGQPVAAGGGHAEAGVLHAQRLKNAPLQHLAQRGAFNHFNDGAQHIGGAAVFPAGAGRVQQGQGGECGRQLLVAVPARAHAGVAVLVGNGAGVPGVAQACRVAQQVVHGGFAGGGRQGAGGSVVHLLPFEGGKVAGHGVRQQQTPFFHQHQRHQRGDGLGHGVDAKHRVWRHGGHGEPWLGWVCGALQAHGFVQHRAAPVLHQRHGAGQHPLGDQIKQHRAHARQGGRVHGQGSLGLENAPFCRCGGAAQGCAQVAPGFVGLMPKRALAPIQQAQSAIVLIVLLRGLLARPGVAPSPAAS